MRQRKKGRINFILGNKTHFQGSMATLIVILPFAVFFCLFMDLKVCAAASADNNQNVSVVRVAVDDSWIPIEYYNEETNTYEGIAGAIFDKLEERGELHFEYEVVGSYEESLELLRQGKVDVISGIGNNHDYAEEMGVELSSPYLKVGCTAVSQKAIPDIFNKKKHYCIGLIKGDVMNQEIRERILGASFIYYDSTKAVMEEVENGNVDIAIIANYAAEYYCRQRAYAKLYKTTIEEFSWEMCIGVDKDCQDTILPKLNRGIQNIDDIDRNQCIYKGISEASQENNWTTILYNYPSIVFIAAGCIILLVVAGYLVITTNQRRLAKDAKLNAKKMRIAMKQTDICLWEYIASKKSVDYVENGDMLHSFHNLRENIPESVIEGGRIHVDDVEKVRKTFARSVGGEQDVVERWRIANHHPGHRDEFLWEEVSLHIMSYRFGKPERIMGVSRDVTKEKQREIAMLKAERYKHSVFQDAVAYYEVDLTANRLLEFDEETGYVLELTTESTFDELAAKSNRRFVEPEFKDAYMHFMNRKRLLKVFDEGGQTDTLEYQARSRSYEVQWFTASNIFTTSKENNHILCYHIVHNINGRKEKELSLREAAERDPLTSLYNRGTFEQLAGQMLEEAMSQKWKAGFVLVDVDNFKSINDQQGHNGGDLALETLGRELENIVGGKGIAGRLGGDEFTMFFPDVKSERNVTIKATVFQKRFNDVALIYNLPFSFTCSVGIAIAKDGDTLETLYKKADQALYEAKGKGKNQFALID